MYGCVKAQSVWFSKNFPSERPYCVTGTGKLTRGLRMPTYVDKTNEAAVKKMMPYGG